MKPFRKEPSGRLLLQFDADFSNLDDLRTEISSSLVTENNLWLSYDEDAGIERLTRTSRGFGYHKHYELTDFFDLPADQDEMDMEGLAYEEPYLWFCGSMSLKRNSPEAEDPLDEQLEDLEEISLDANRFSLGCIPCIKTDGSYELVNESTFEGEKIYAKQLRGGAASSELHNALVLDPHLGPFMTIPCKDNGFDIEGLAIYEGRIFLGLRGPVLNGYAIILEITCETLGNELIMMQRPGEDLLYRKHFLDLAGMGIRELNIIPNGDLYLLAGPTMDLDGTISIYRIKGGLPDRHASVVHQPERLFDVARGAELEHGIEKAEGMAFLSDKEVLITYDSPGEDRLEGPNGVWMDLFDL